MRKVFEKNENSPNLSFLQNEKLEKDELFKIKGGEGPNDPPPPPPPAGPGN